jgi:hypothetical protein
MSTNSMKNNITFIIFQCSLIDVCYNATICAVNQCMAIAKTRTTNTLCLCSSIMCSKSKKEKRNRKQKKNHEKNEKKNKKTEG